MAVADDPPSPIEEYRRLIERSITEVNRWGMVLDAATDLREALRRVDETADGGEVIERFERLVEGAPDETADDRRKHLAYLFQSELREGPAEGSTFHDYASDQGGPIATFADTFEAFARGDAGTEQGQVVAEFQAAAVNPTVSATSAQDSEVVTLVALVETGLLAAKAQREAAIDALNDTYDDEDTLASRGLIYQFHASGDGSEGGAVVEDASDLERELTEDITREVVEGVRVEDPSAAQAGYKDRLSELSESPVAMLPVGLQTRFVSPDDDRTGDDHELWIRVFPDDVHVDTHEPELTPQEERWGKTFWTRLFVARHPYAGTVDADTMEAVRDGDASLAVYDDLRSGGEVDEVVDEVVDRLLVAGTDGRTIDDFHDSPERRHEEVRERAWGQVVERAGRERGAYVVHATAPVDQSAADEPDTADAILAGPPGALEDGAADVTSDPLDFPYVEHRPGSWTRQPRARLLPDRWVAIVEWTEGGEQHSARVVARNAVREPLYMAPNPESLEVAQNVTGGSESGSDSDGDGDDVPGTAAENIATGMEWMVDFDAAERAGMALRVRTEDLSTDQLPDTFDRVTVLGVKVSMEEDATREGLQELLDIHHYTRGLELLPEGTPTNNHKGSSGYSRSDDPTESVDTEAAAPLLDRTDPTDGNVLANLLGVAPAAGEGHVFGHVEGADATEWLDAYHMHSVLWPGTLGAYLRHLLFPRADLDDGAEVGPMLELLIGGVRDFFVQSVRGGGPLPTLRIGSQPYGVLPAMSVDAHASPGTGGTTGLATAHHTAVASDMAPMLSGDPEQSAYWFVLAMVRRFREHWDSSLPKVPRLDPERAADASGTPTPEDVVRDLQDVAASIKMVVWDEDDEGGDTDALVSKLDDLLGTDAIDDLEQAANDTIQHEEVTLERDGDSPAAVASVVSDIAVAADVAELDPQQDDEILETLSEGAVTIGSTVQGRLDAVLRQTSVSTKISRRQFYLEDLQGRGYVYGPVHSPSPARALDNLGVPFHPRLARMRYYDVGPNQPKFPYTDMVASKSDREPSPAPVRATSGYLGDLADVEVGDLVRLGYDLKLNRFPYLFGAGYTRMGSIYGWSDLEGLFDWQPTDFQSWFQGGPKPSWTTRLEGLLDVEDSWVWEISQQDNSRLDSIDREVVTEDLVEELVGAAAEDSSDNDLAFHELFVGALDGYLGTGERLQYLDFDSGDSLTINTGRQDGHEHLPQEFEDIDTKVADLFVRHGREDTWPDAAGQLKDFFEALTKAVYDVLDIDHHGIVTGNIPTDDSSLRSITENHFSDVIVEYRGGLIVVNGDVFDIELPGGSYNIPEALERGNEIVFDTAANLFYNLVRYHVQDYFVLALTFNRIPLVDSRSEYTSFRDPSPSALPVGPESRWATKVHRDTTLFNMITWYSTVHEALNTVVRQDDVDPETALLGRRPGYDNDTMYDLLDRRTPDGVRENMEWDEHYDPPGDPHPLEDQYAAHRWFGALDMMRSEEYVGHDGTDDRLAAFQASLEWMDQEGWLTRDRLDRTDRLFSSTLDLASHRLDAWWTALATTRLQHLRGGTDAFDLELADAWVRADGDGTVADGGHATSLESGSEPGIDDSSRARDGDFPDEDDQADEDDDLFVEEDSFGIDIESESEPTLEEQLSEPESAIDEYDIGEEIEEPARDWTLDRDGATLDSYGPDGTYVGAYGFVENLESDVHETKREDETERENETEREDEAEREYEYIQTPSLHHATTAAILRSGYRSHPASDHREALDIDLSPERVRKARWVTDGLRQGLSMSEMLGYFFERRLHQVSKQNADVDLEKYIAPLREFAPLLEGELDRNGDEDEPTRQLDVVDGYELFQKVLEKGFDHLHNSVGVHLGDKADLEAVFEEVEELVDSVSDLVVAENVHQLQQGNYDQAGRSLSALAEGKLPRDPDVIRMHRDSVGVTHRLLVLFGLEDDHTGATVEVPSEWNASRDAMAPSIDDDGTLETDPDGSPVTVKRDVIFRRRGAPVLDAFAGRTFPDPKDVQCVAEYRWTTEEEDDGSDGSGGDSDGGNDSSGSDDSDGNGSARGETEHIHETSVSLDDLDLSPLDALYLTQQSGDAGASKLERHIAYYLLRNRPDVSPSLPIPGDATVDVSFRKLPEGADADAVSVADFVELSRSLRDLVLDARPADATDLAHPGEPAESEGLEVGTVEGRANAAEERLEEIAAVIHNRVELLAPPEEDDEAAVVTDSDGDGADSSGNGSDASDSNGNGTNSSGDDADGDGGSGGADGDAPTPFERIVEPVERIAKHLPEYAEETNVESVAAEADQLSGDDLLQELDDIVDGLPAGPADPDKVDESLVVKPGTASVGGSLPFGLGNVNAVVEAQWLTVAGECEGRGDPKGVVAIDTRTDEVVAMQQIAGPVSQFQANLDLRLGNQPGLPLARIEIRLTGEGEITELRGVSPDLVSASKRVTLGIGPADLIDDLRNNDLDVRVAAESVSAADRFRDETNGVPVDKNGRYETTVDVSDARPGTAFDLVATYDWQGSDWVVDARHGRVVDDGSLQRLTGSDVEDLTVLPRLLWIELFADSFQPRGHADDDGAVLPAIADGDFGLSDRGQELDRQFEGVTVDIGPGSADDLAAAFNDVEPNPAGNLAAAFDDVDWRALERERELFPEDNTTLSEPQRDAVDALIDLQDVDLKTVADCVSGDDGPLGVVTPVAALGLTEAISTIGGGSPYGEGQRFYPGTDAAMGEARARITGFLETHWPPADAWQSGELLAVGQDVLEDADQADVLWELRVLVHAARDDAWTVDALGDVVRDPHRLVRLVDDLLFHPDELDATGRDDALNHLDTLVSTVSSSSADIVARRIEALGHVDDAVADFATPVQDLVSGLRTAASDRRGDDGLLDRSDVEEMTDRTRFRGAFDDSAAELDRQATLLAAAARSVDLADALREGLLETLRRPMVRAAYFGVYSAMPGEVTGGSDTVRRNLVRQARATLAEIDERLAAAEAASDPDALEQELDRLRSLFGDSYVVLPPFTPDNVGELRATLRNEDELLDHEEAGPLEVQTWFQRAARVRESPQLLRETLTYADAVNDGDRLDLSVGQLPHYPEDDWIGIDGVRPETGGRVSLVARADEGMTDLVEDPPDEPPAVAGLLIDEWNEEVPSEEEHTAVSFRYDDPNNQPPQAILLATPPPNLGDESPWTLPTLAATVEETLDMTKYRAVDLESLVPHNENARVALGHFLPGLYFAQDVHIQPNEPSLDFTPLDKYGEYMANVREAGIGHRMFQPGVPTSLFGQRDGPGFSRGFDLEVGGDGEGGENGTDTDDESEGDQ